MRREWFSKDDKKIYGQLLYTEKLLLLTKVFNMYTISCIAVLVSNNDNYVYVSINNLLLTDMICLSIFCYVKDMQ